MATSLIHLSKLPNSINLTRLFTHGSLVPGGQAPAYLTQEDKFSSFADLHYLNGIEDYNY